MLRFDGRVPRPFWDGYFQIFYLITVVGLFFLNVFKIHRTLWRYVGLPTALSILNALTLAYVVVYLLNLILSPQPLPRGVVILSWILSEALVLGARFAWRIADSPGRRPPRTGRRILIVGAGDIGVMVARELSRSVSYPGHTIGFVDDDQRKRGARVEGLEVLGSTFDLPRLILERQVGEVIIAAPSAPTRLVRQVVRVCMETGVACRTVPALADYIKGKGALDQVREVRIEDLLGRDTIEIDLPGIRQRLANRVVLVTGAGGSIGSELCRQIARFEPGRLVLLDHNENSLTYLGLELKDSHPGLDLLHAVGDIRDEVGMRQLFLSIRPDLVFHAAAHKHVNLLEMRPREAVLNNILGTRNVARASEDAGVETLTLISTDKAVDPSSVMGASKRACEMMLQGMSRRSRCTMVAVRFGNVIGSEGSVLPIFRQQLARGGPLTVTHPNARRYFMTIPEASQLVIQAALNGQSGDVFILDMGEPVRILDVARQLIRLNGLEPDRDVRIEFIGLRPGEKLEEEIFTDLERMRATRHAKIFRCELGTADPDWLDGEIERLIDLATHGAPDAIRQAMKRIVPEYRELTPEPLRDPQGQSTEAALTSIAPGVRDFAGKRALDIVGALLSLLLLSVPTGLAWLLLRLSGPATVTFVAEEQLGANRRHMERRVQDRRVGIDRRDAQRRKRKLPGRTFITYRMVVGRPATNPLQRWMARWVEASRLDRLPYLWNVLRGDMSIVGPSVHLLESDTWKQDEVTAWCFARRPGLTGPAQILGGGEEVPIYDDYYARHANWRLDLDALRLSLPRLFHRSTNSKESGETLEARASLRLPQSSTGKGGIS